MRAGLVSIAAGVLLACSSSGTTTTTGGGGSPVACTGDAGCADGYLCTSGFCTRTSTDGRPPAVVAATPADADQNVWVGQTIQATFSEPMRLGDGDASVSVTTFAGEVAKTLELSADGRTLTIHAPDLAGPDDVSIFFGPGFTDLSGLTVSNYPPFHWSFVCPQWQTPGGSFPQPSGPYGVESGAVAVDALGRGVAAVEWRPDGTNHALRVLRWELETWVPELDHALGTDDYVSDVRLAARGDAVVLAYSHAPWGATSSSIEVSTFRSDAWTSLPTLSVPMGGAVAVRLGVGPDLAPVIAWNDGAVLHASRWDPAQGAWKALVDVPKPSSGSSMYLGDLRVDAAGVTHAAFFDWTGYVGNVWVVKWTEASADPLGGPATSAASVLEGPSLGFDLVGRPLVAYEKTGGGFGVSRFDGAAWTETLTVPASGSDRRLRPSLAIDPVLGVFVGVQTGAQFVSAWRDDGSGWVQLDGVESVPLYADVTFLHLADGVGHGPWAAYQVEAALNVKRFNHQ